MSENNKKPDVFNKKQQEQANVYESLKTPEEIKAAEEMARRTEEQIAARDAVLEKLKGMGELNEAERQKYIREMMPKVIREDLSESVNDKPRGSVVYEEPVINEKEKPHTIFPVLEHNTEKTNESYVSSLKKEILDEVDQQIKKNHDILSQPQFDSLFDMVPLPSKGKQYGIKDGYIKVSFLNASDENILTNPNLLDSGKFLEILLNRKILDTRIRYQDLTIGDRDALMIWLRYTGYGDIYPISVTNPKDGLEFETEIELSKLKVNKLELEPDSQRCFSFSAPSNGDDIRFKFITVGDLDELQEEEDRIIETVGEEFINRTTSVLCKQIKSINGNSDPTYVKKYVESMRLGDVKAFRKFISDNEFGVDMNLTVLAPGGEPIKTFFPLNLQFFWPEQ